MALTPDEICNEWKSDLLQRYHHYSCKVVNSNTEGGVRLGAKQALNLPHLCGRTLLHDSISTTKFGASRGLELDYTKQDSTKTTKQLRSWMGDEDVKPNKPIDLPIRQRQEISKLYEEMMAGDHPGHEVPNPLPVQLKQLLLPTEGGEFISATPLPCLQVAKSTLTVVGTTREHFFAVIKSLNAKKTTQAEKISLNEELREIPTFRKIRELPVGGANTQNVGSQAFFFTSPVIFDQLPRTSKDERSAFGIAFNGIRFYLPRECIKVYSRFLEKVRARSEAGMNTWTADDAIKETPYLQAFTESWQRQARKARELLEDHKDLMPAPLPYLTEHAESDRFTGWLNPEMRSPQWQKGEAMIMAKTLRGAELGINNDGQILTLGLSQTDLDRITDTIVHKGLM